MLVFIYARPRTIKQLIFTSAQDLCSVCAGSLVVSSEASVLRARLGFGVFGCLYTTEKQREVW